MVDSIELFLDVNVYLDAIVVWQTDQTYLPFEYRSGVSVVNNAPGVIVDAIYHREVVNGRELVLHTSARVLGMIEFKLQSEYRWELAAIDRASDLFVHLVATSGGRICEDPPKVLQLPGLTDQEDVHRYSEASATGAELLVTSDHGFLAVNDAGLRPQIVSPSSVVRFLPDPTSSAAD